MYACLLTANNKIVKTSNKIQTNGVQNKKKLHALEYIIRCFVKKSM